MAGFDDYESYDALGLAALVRTGEVTAEELLDAALGRLDARDPALNAVVHRMDDDARAAIAAGLPDGPFRGVPYMLKDLYLLADGHPTTNGSRLFADFVADHDSTYVARLRAAGLVLTAKTNTPEFGLNMTTEPALHGPTRNPWGLGLSAGGSSGGSAAAVAAGILPAAHATDGGGSIRIPAAQCGLFGLKPTRARNPAGPDIGEGWSGLSTGHAVTRSVRDSAALLDATNGPAPGDPYVAPAPARAYAAEVGADPGSLRIALLDHGMAGEAIDPECVHASRDAAKLCESLGHRVEPAVPEVDVPSYREAMRVIISANVRNTLDARAQARGRAVDEAREVETMTRLFAEEGARLPSAAYARAIVTLHTTGRRFARFFATYDVLLSPTIASPPLPLGTFDMMGDDLDTYCNALFEAIPFTPLYNVTGCPAATLPLHWTADGLPVGVQLGAQFGDEATLFRLAAQLEAARPWADRRPPEAV